MLVTHLHFCFVYITEFWDPHFQFHKKKCPHTRTPGFLAIHMAVHYFVQQRDFENMRRNWKTMPSFQAFQNTFLPSRVYTPDHIVDTFFNWTAHRQEKHFKQWKTHLFFSVAISNQQNTLPSGLLMGVYFPLLISCMIQIYVGQA